MLARALVLALLLAACPVHASRVAYKLSGGSEFKGLAVSWPNVLVADTQDGDCFESDAGVVKVYDGRTGALAATLREPSDEWDGLFGRAVAASGRWVAVTSGYDRVHIFDNHGQFVHTLRRNEPHVSHFGDRLALGGDFLVVRELADIAPSRMSADVFIHVYNVETGALLHSFVGGSGVSDFRDVMVVANGDTLITGTPSGGVVCAYHARSGIWRWCTPSPRRYGGDRFGSALSVYGNDLLVGAPGGHRLEFGNAFLLDVQTGEIQRKYHGPGRGSEFGTSVAVQGSLVLIGAPDSYARGGVRGKTYLLDKRTGRVLRTYRPMQVDADGYTGGTVAFIGLRPAVVDVRESSWMPPVIRVFR